MDNPLYFHISLTVLSIENGSEELQWFEFEVIGLEGPQSNCKNILELGEEQEQFITSVFEGLKRLHSIDCFSIIVHNCFMFVFHEGVQSHTVLRKHRLYILVNEAEHVVVFFGLQFILVEVNGV